MAPIRDTTRAELLAAIVAGKWPFCVSCQNAPFARLEQAGGRWALRRLRLDGERARQASEEALAAGRGFRSENTWPFYEPAETIYSANSPESLARAVRLGSWPPRRAGLRWLLAKVAGVFG
jgi:hypothetical protein